MGLIDKWEADICRSFENLNGISLNLNELRNEVRIPANQISEYVDSAHKFFRLIPGLLEASNRSERRSINIERLLQTILSKLVATSAVTSSIDQSIMSPSTAVISLSPAHTAKPERFAEFAKLSQRSTSSIFICWYSEELHRCTPPPGEDRSRLREFAVFIFFAKKFLRSGSTIMMKPPNDSVATMLVWHQSIINYSKIIEEGIVKFLENNRYEWMKRNTAPTTCKRRITSE